LREIAERYQRDMAEMVQGLQPSLGELARGVSGSGDEEVRRIAREFNEGIQKPTDDFLDEIKRKYAELIAQQLPPRQDPDAARHKKLVEDVLTIQALLRRAEHKLEGLRRELENGRDDGAPPARR